MKVIYRDIIQARRSGDRAALSALSLQLAVQRLLRATGRNHVAVMHLPRDAEERDRLYRKLQSMGLGRIAFRVTLEQTDAEERQEDLVLLVPVADQTVFEVLARHAAAVGAAIGDADDLVGVIQQLRPGWRVVAVDLPPSTFVDALGEMKSSKPAI